MKKFLIMILVLLFLNTISSAMFRRKKKAPIFQRRDPFTSIGDRGGDYWRNPQTYINIYRDNKRFKMDENHDDVPLSVGDKRVNRKNRNHMIDEEIGRFERFYEGRDDQNLINQASQNYRNDLEQEFPKKKRSWFRR
eukprot:TRINITY_DN17959_c0_g1_i1.p1 TRINITY_DN17959_c0_g1~~TRINITY_DN17959_c0_g1_i1.p1  ORF type:complete len:137 (+),score=30.45 TRINITY_DN17959_c0_g1_i1:7-417(+)